MRSQILCLYVFGLNPHMYACFLCNIARGVYFDVFKTEVNG